MAADPDLARAIAFMRALRLRVGRRIEELPYGLAFFDSELPHVWDLNLIWVDELPGDLTAAALAADAERLQGPVGLEHRRVELNADGEQLVEGFATLGWTHESLVLMAHRRSPDRTALHVVIREIDADEVQGFTDTSWRADPEGHAEDVIRQLALQPGRYADAGARFLGVEVDGELVTTIDLYQDGDVAQLESLLTLEPHRNRGYATALLLQGLAEARAGGASLVFIQAEEAGWPKALYGKLGWVPIGRTSTFTRHPPE